MRQGEGKGSLLIFQSVVKGGVNDHTFSGPAFCKGVPTSSVFCLSSSNRLWSGTHSDIWVDGESVLCYMGIKCQFCNHFASHHKGKVVKQLESST